MNPLLRSITLAACLLANFGCAGGMSQSTRRNHAQTSTESCSRPQIERGDRRPVIDGIGWVVGIPGKIILWDRRIDNHQISPETETAITHYVNVIGLEDTKIRLNQYAPIDEWRRLTANRSVHWGWRYTLGTLTWLDDAIFPGRVFGGDRYNAYTNTISIFSDAPSIAIKEGSRARDVKSRRYPGTYAAVNSLPLVSMWYETVSTSYAMEYLHDEMPETEREGYHLLYPAYGAHLGSDLTSFTNVPNTIGAAIGAIPGHIVGRYQGRQLPSSETARAQSDDEERPENCETNQRNSGRELKVILTRPRPRSVRRLTR